MAGSTYGKILTMTTWGESHGAGVGVVVDGCPAGLALCEEDVQRYLDRRKPGQSRFTTKRSESDTVEILSGVFEGRTTGTPISMLVRNQDQHSKDYSEIASYYRPGHADYTFDEKYGFRDYRGGGRSSGRETIGRVAAGAIAAKLLESLNIQVKAYTKAIGPVEVAPDRFDLAECEKNKLYMPDAAAAAEAEQYLERKMAEKDSAGGIVECVNRFLINLMRTWQRQSARSVLLKASRSERVSMRRRWQEARTTTHLSWIRMEASARRRTMQVAF